MKPFTLDTAIGLAALAHEGQRDMAGEPYILHPTRVMLAQTSNLARIVGELHDTIEDSKGLVTIVSLRTMACPEDALEALDLVTFPKGLTTEEYLARVKKIKLNAIATAVKLADLRDNTNIDRIRGRREGLNEKDMKRLQKYLDAITILKGDGL